MSSPSRRRRLVVYLLCSSAAAILAVLAGWVNRGDGATRISILVALALLNSVGGYIAIVGLPPSNQEEPTARARADPPREGVLRRVSVAVITIGYSLGRSLLLVLVSLPVAGLRLIRQSQARHLGVPPRMLLPRQTAFRGREHELRRLTDLHDALRRQAAAPPDSGPDGPEPRGPIMLFVNGAPGVGKTAVARELAQRLKRQYPDGQLYANLGLFGGRRPERDVLRAFLRELGQPRDEGRDADAEELVQVLRAATAGKSLLVFLDAARDLDQVKGVLPASQACAVIVTSRVMLADIVDESIRLPRPSPSDAALILCSYLSGDDDLSDATLLPDPELVAEAAELCGRQALALRATGELARITAGGLSEVVNRLRSSNDRLAELTYLDRDISVRISSEYKLVTGREQQALQVLSVIDAASFVPWVLQPLLETDLNEAANLMAGLAKAGLLDERGRDPSGFARYELSPLIRLYALRDHDRNVKSGTELGNTSVNATETFQRAVAAMSAEILGLDSDKQLGQASWLPQIPDWKERVLANAEFWVRAEFPNLLDAVCKAHEEGAHAVARTLAELFGDCEVTYPFNPRVGAAFDAALDSAQGHPNAIVGLVAAKGSCLLAAEEYDLALKVLAEAALLTVEVGRPDIAAVVRRRIGQAKQRLGAYAEAADNFRRALADARLAKRTSEIRLIELLIAENRAVTEPEFWSESLPAESCAGTSSQRYAEHLVRARHARIHSDHILSSSELVEASKAIDQETRRAFTLQIEQLHVSLSETSPSTEGREQLIADAAHVVLETRQAGALISAAEARVLLARALLAGDRVEASIEVLDRVFDQPSTAMDNPRLRAASEWARGEALLKAGTKELLRDRGNGKLREAEQSLSSAAATFADIADTHSQGEVQYLLGTAQLKLEAPYRAQRSFAAAAEIFDRCQDITNRDHAAEAQRAALGRLTGRRRVGNRQ